MDRQELSRQVILDGRERDISYAMFRNKVGKKLGLNLMDFVGLDLVFFRGATTPSELTRYTGLSSGSTTAMIDRLEASGLVVRQPSATDRRVTVIALVREKAETIVPLFQSLKAAQDELLSNYSEHELEILSDYFRRSGGIFESERKKLN